MEFKLFKVSGYEEAIMSLRMSKGKFYSWEKAQEIQDLVYAVTDRHGFMELEGRYQRKLLAMGIAVTRNDEYGVHYREHGKITGAYGKDVAEFKRLLGITMDNAMGAQTHHTLMKYIDISFITEGLHRGAQDDLDSHAIAFNNRITRYSTRLAEIDSVDLSEWYQDKVIPFGEVLNLAETHTGDHQLPRTVKRDGETFVLTPFGYVLEKYAQVPAKNGLAKDVQRGLMPLGMASNGLWKIDLFNLRYVYHMRGKLTKTNPELKDGMEMLADQIEQHVPVFGEHFREVFTDSKQWEHTGRAKTITGEEFKLFQQLKKQAQSDT